MRYIDRTGCTKMSDRGQDMEITKKGALTRTATRIAEENGLGVLERRDGIYRIINASGLGAYSDFFTSLAEVDDFLKNLSQHNNTKY